jgi:hypothetical protein
MIMILFSLFYEAKIILIWKDLIGTYSKCNKLLTCKETYFGIRLMNNKINTKGI